MYPLNAGGVRYMDIYNMLSMRDFKKIFRN